MFSGNQTVIKAWRADGHPEKQQQKPPCKYCLNFPEVFAQHLKQEPREVGSFSCRAQKNRKELIGDTHSRLNKLFWSTKKSNFYVATVKWASAGFFLRPQQARSQSSPYHTPCRCTDPIFKIALQKGRQAVPGSINQAHPAEAAAAAAVVGGVFHSYDSADQYGAVQSQHGNSAFFTTKGKKVTKKRSNLASSPSSGPQTSQPEQSIHSGHGSTSVCPENVWLDFRILMCFWTETGRDH